MSARATTDPLRVLAVDHTAGITSFRRKFAALAACPGIQLTVLAPERWVENYREVAADSDRDPGYRFVRGRIGWPGYENRAFFQSGLGPAIRRARPHVLHLWEEPFSVITLQALSLAALWAPRAVPIFFSSDNLSRDFQYAIAPRRSTRAWSASPTAAARRAQRSTTRSWTCCAPRGSRSRSR